VSVLWQYLLIALYAVAVLVHNLACLAWLVALMEGPEHSWAAAVEWASQGPGSLPNCSPAEQYLAALYWVFETVTTTGYGERQTAALGLVWGAWCVKRFYFSGPEHSWAAAVEWASQGPGSLPNCSPAEQYLAALYWVFETVTTTGYGRLARLLAVPTCDLLVEEG
jgi:hypothetical protein